MAEAKPLVYVVDDDESVRSGVGRLVRSIGLRVVAYPDAQAFLDAALEEAPSCLVLDLQLPGLSGLELQQMMTEKARSLPIIFVTGHGDIPTTVRAMKAGAAEFLTKPVAPAELIDAIERSVRKDASERLGRAELAELRSRYDSLTPRERDVLAGVTSGALNKQIAANFGTTEFTVKEQRAKVMSKMKAQSVADLVRMVARLGLDPKAGSA
jgi:FixJ family two-component response regulator